MSKVAFHIPISEKQIERSRTHPAPAPIIEPLKKIMKAHRQAPEPAPVDPLKKKRKSRAPKPKIVITSFALPKQKNAAGIRDESIFARPIYIAGDGDVILPRRPGSLDFLGWPSVGNSC